MPALSVTAAAFGYGRPQRGAVGSGDKILDSLTTSAAAYTAASANTWIKITETEYNTMQTKVTGTTLAGATDATITAIGANTNFTTGGLAFYNQTSATTPAIPANTYLYAFKMYINATISNMQVYANNNSDTSANGFVAQGGVLPTSTAGYNYYVLKGVANVNYAAAPTSLLLWTSNVLPMGFKQNVGASGVKHAASSTAITVSTNVNSTFGNASAFAIQGLCTTTKQWP
jgi:hypothetical protein